MNLLSILLKLLGLAVLLLGGWAICSSVMVCSDCGNTCVGCTEEVHFWCLIYMLTGGFSFIFGIFLLGISVSVTEDCEVCGRELDEPLRIAGHPLCARCHAVVLRRMHSGESMKLEALLAKERDKCVH